MARCLVLVVASASALLRSVSRQQLRKPAALVRFATAASLRELVVDAEGRGRGLDRSAVRRIRGEIESLEASASAWEASALEGRWRVLATVSPESADGEENAVPFFSVKSWRDYVGGEGPSPVQSLVAGASTVGGLTQKLTLEGADRRFDNIVSFGWGSLVIRATLEENEAGCPAGSSRLTFRFKDGEFLVKNALFGGTLSLPYPVPFGALGDRAVGWLETTVLDEASGIRVAKGNKGTYFVFERATDLENDADLRAARDARDDASYGASESDAGPRRGASTVNFRL